MIDQESHEWLTKLTENPVARTPYMLTDIGLIQSRCATFRKLFPAVRLFYAIKALSDKEVIMAIDEMVDGYDAASEREIQMLVGLGVNAERIAFSNPIKPSGAIEVVARLGVNMFAFQSKSELEKIARCAPKSKVYVRVKMDDSHSAVPLSVKYGCPPAISTELLLYAKQLGLDPIGITFHIGSQQTGLDSWGKAINKSQQLLREARAAGLDVSLINLGGGFPAQYVSTDPSISEISEVINPALDNDKGVEYMAESGRFIVADSSVIVSSIISMEHRDGKRWLYLDVGLFQAFTGAQRFEPFPYPPVSLRHLKDDDINTETVEYVITGPTCDSHDIICDSAVLPVDLAEGDIIVFPKTGAYTVVYGSDFNGFPIPKRYFINTR